ncbi:MAG: L-threonylcarbamoyladenylate synthase [Candidatus Heimdallarchaeota archaeon]
MIITANPEKVSKTILFEANQVLENDGLIVYPTETAYGIGCNAFSEVAIKKIFTIKKRSEKSPLPVIVDSVRMMKDIAQPTDEALLLSNHFHPGPLVLALLKKPIISDLLNPKGIALRISSNHIIHEIVKAFKKPIVSTSANLSGDASPYNIKDVTKSLNKKQIHLIIDAGQLPKRNPSTLVDFTMSPSPQIIREGEIKAEGILKVLDIPQERWSDHMKNLSK